MSVACVCLGSDCVRARLASHVTSYNVHALLYPHKTIIHLAHRIANCTQYRAGIAQAHEVVQFAAFLGLFAQAQTV